MNFEVGDIVKHTYPGGDGRYILVVVQAVVRSDSFTGEVVYNSEKQGYHQVGHKSLNFAMSVFTLECRPPSVEERFNQSIDRLEEQLTDVYIW